MSAFENKKTLIRNHVDTECKFYDFITITLMINRDEMTKFHL